MPVGERSCRLDGIIEPVGGDGVVGLRGRTKKVSESIEDLLGGSPAAVFEVLCGSPS